MAYEEERIEYQRPAGVAPARAAVCDSCGKRAGASPEEVERIRGLLHRGAGAFPLPPLPTKGWVEVSEVVDGAMGAWRQVLKLFCVDCRGKAGVS